METEPPILPAGKITLYHLTSEWSPPDPSRPVRDETLRNFNDYFILSEITFTDQLAAALRRTLGHHHTYQGERMRCFIPRHGLRFGDSPGADALICLECHVAYFWLDGVRFVYALSETAVEILGTYFRSAEPASRGLDPAQVLHEASFGRPPGNV